MAARAASASPPAGRARMGRRRRRRTSLGPPPDLMSVRFAGGNIRGEQSSTCGSPVNITAMLPTVSLHDEDHTAPATPERPASSRGRVAGNPRSRPTGCGQTQFRAGCVGQTSRAHSRHRVEAIQRDLFTIGGTGPPIGESRAAMERARRSSAPLSGFRAAMTPPKAAPRSGLVMRPEPPRPRSTPQTPWPGRAKRVTLGRARAGARALLVYLNRLRTILTLARSRIFETAAAM